MQQDKEHLRLLSIFHYILGGMTALFALFPIFHLIFGIILLVVGEAEKNGGPPAIVGLIFIFIALTFILLGWTLAICMFIGGYSLGHYKRYTYCFIIACIECIFMPFGTVLGVFTIIVLNRETVKELFKEKDMTVPEKVSRF